MSDEKRKPHPGWQEGRWSATLNLGVVSITAGWDATTAKGTEGGYRFHVANHRSKKLYRANDEAKLAGEDFAKRELQRALEKLTVPNATV